MPVPETIDVLSLAFRRLTLTDVASTGHVFPSSYYAYLCSKMCHAMQSFHHSSFQVGRQTGNEFSNYSTHYSRTQFYVVMCGILAIFGLTRCTAEEMRPSALALSKLLRHRGPDWNGIHCARNCLLAHERLAVVGLHTGAQPIANRDGSAWLSVNGEIYNYVELQGQLDKACLFVLHITYSQHETLSRLTSPLTLTVRCCSTCTASMADTS